MKLRHISRKLSLIPAFIPNNSLRRTLVCFKRSLLHTILRSFHKTAAICIQTEYITKLPDKHHKNVLTIHTTGSAATIIHTT